MFNKIWLLVLTSAALQVSQMVSAEVSTLELRTEMQRLPGGLDKVQVLNSNSPEVVQTEGILVSTFAPLGKATPAAHLNHRFQGRFDIFAHHIAKADPLTEQPTLYLAIIVQNAGKRPASLKTLQGASYLSQPDAPFVALNASQDNAEGTVFAGPGDRVMDDVLRHKLQKNFSAAVDLPAGVPEVLAALPIPVKGLTPPLNGRSLLLQLSSEQPLYVATVAAFARKNADGTERRPSDEEFIELLNSGGWAGPREKAPSEPSAGGNVVYGRVGGVQAGSTWSANLGAGADNNEQWKIPAIGQSISYPISAVAGGAFGTGQVQAAGMLKREPETAYAAHGNYGVKYDITVPMVNRLKCDALVLVKLQTPLKMDQKLDTISFNRSANSRIFFRGTVKSSYVDSQKIGHEKYTHLVQHQGESGPALVAQYLKPNEQRTVKLEFLYPPDATPPQVLTIESTDPNVLED